MRPTNAQIHKLVRNRVFFQLYFGHFPDEMEQKDFIRTIQNRRHYADGKLPDIDYTLMRMRNLDDLNSGRNPLYGRVSSTLHTGQICTN